MRILILFFIVLGSVCHAELRTWTAVNGKEVEAEFVSNEKGIVKLKLKSSKVFEVPLNKLSKSDQEFLKAKSSSGSLADTIVGRLITFKSDKGETMQILLNEDGRMMGGENGSIEDIGLTYKIEGNEVLVFKKEERDGGISFSSSSPKVGDQVEMGPKKRIESAKVTKIENAPQTAVNSSTEKQQKLKGEVKPEEPLAETKPELEGVNGDELEEREGIMYLNGSDTPYTGKVFNLYENGQKISEENYKDGKLDGLWLMLHDNGQKWSEGNYKDGKLDGLWVRWHENGQKKGEATFKDDKHVEGSGKWWNSKGEPVDSREEANKK